MIREECLISWRRKKRSKASDRLCRLFPLHNRLTPSGAVDQGKLQDTFDKSLREEMSLLNCSLHLNIYCKDKSQDYRQLDSTCP